MQYDIYPLTLVFDRYCGTYSGGKWVAWNSYPECIPEGPDEDDVSCAEFWMENTQVVGLGDTPDEAINDLRTKLDNCSI